MDKSGIVADRLESTPELQFEVSDKDYEQLRQSRQNGGDDIWGILVIGPDIVNAPSDVQLFTFSSSTWEIENAVSAQIKRIIEAENSKHTTSKTCLGYWPKSKRPLRFTPST